MEQDIEGLVRDFDEQLAAKNANKEKVLHAQLNTLLSRLDIITEKLHASCAPDDKKEDKAGEKEYFKGMGKREEPRRADYDDQEDEEEDEEYDDEYLEDEKKFSGGRKNEFSGGKSSLSRKW